MSNTWNSAVASISVGVASAAVVLWIHFASRRREFFTTQSFDAWVRRAQTVSVLVGVLSGCVLGGAIATMVVAPPLQLLRLLTIGAGAVILAAGFGVLHRSRSAPFQRRLVASSARGAASPRRVALMAIGAWGVTIAYVLVQTIAEWNGASSSP